MSSVNHAQQGKQAERQGILMAQFYSHPEAHES